MGEEKGAGANKSGQRTVLRTSKNGIRWARGAMCAVTLVAMTTLAAPAASG